MVGYTSFPKEVRGDGTLRLPAQPPRALRATAGRAARLALHVACLAFTQSAPWSFQTLSELSDSPQSPLRSSFEHTLNQGPFPRPALPGFIGRMGPSDACHARLPMEPLPVPCSATGFEFQRRLGLDCH
jgi:hypothetical protein